VSTWLHPRVVGWTYRQQEINYVHETEDNIGNICVTVHVGNRNRDTGDDMVGEHLVMIFAAFFEMDNEDLLEPKGQLHEVVPLERP
jgi:hypothetical protein